MTGDHLAAPRNRNGTDRAITHQTRHRSLTTLGAYVRVQQAWGHFTSAFGGAELRAAFAQQAVGRIVPVLVEPVTLPALYAPLIRLDLTGLDEPAVVARLRARLTGGRPTSAPPFPRAGPTPTVKPAFARALPAVRQVPPRNPRFSSRYVRSNGKIDGIPG